jgi:MFS family permease
MLAKAEIRRGLRISTWEGACSQVHAVLVSNAFLIGFALAWGANDFHLGLLGAIPFLAQLFQMVGAYLVDRWAERRREIVATLGFAARGSWFVLALLPFIIHRTSIPIMPSILVAFLFYQLAYCASGPGWVAWLSVLVPERLRGRYLGRRNLVTEIVGMLTALCAGLAIDTFRAAERERLGFAVLQLVAAAAGITCFLLMRRQPDPGHHTPEPELKWRYLLRPLHDVRFRWLCGFNLCWSFGLNVCTPFFNAHLLKNLHWDFKHLALLGVLSSVVAVVMNPVWGRLADRHGYKPLLKLCALGLLHLPLYYVFCPWNTSWPIYMTSILYGLFWSGFNLAMFSLTLASLPLSARAMGAAVFSAVTGPATFLSGVLSGSLAQNLGAVHWQFGALVVVNYQLLFLLSILLRVPTFALLRRIHEPETSRGHEPAPVPMTELSPGASPES